MALKDLLVYVDDSKANAERVDAAVRLAAAHDAHLAALCVAPLRNVTSHYIQVARLPAALVFNTASLIPPVPEYCRSDAGTLDFAASISSCNLGAG